MELVLPIIFLLIGFVLLIKGADFFVEGSSSVAVRLKIPALIIGLTIVAMGTSLPELSVSVVASLNGSNSLSVSNAIGSNIFNLLVVLGVSSLLNRLTVSKDVLKRDFPLSIICLVLVLLAGIFSGGILRGWGITFLIIFVFYMILIVRSATKSRQVQLELADATDQYAMQNDHIEESAKKVALPIWRSILYIIGGVIAIKFGGDWVVDNAVVIAEYFHLSEALIGLTIVSIGTSLPELVTSITAARKGELEMAVGNAIGSNIFNILLILGISSIVSPISMIRENLIDTLFLLVVSLLTMFFCRTRFTLAKKEGAILIALYILYMIYILLR